MWWPTWFIQLMIVAYYLSPSSARNSPSFVGFDCTAESAVNTARLFRRPQDCKEHIQQLPTTSRWDLFQLPSTKPRKGSFCQRTRSSLKGHCGFLSHLQAIEPFAIGVEETVSLEDCEEWHSKMLYHDRSTGKTFQLNQGKNFVRFFSSGGVTSSHDGSYNCFGRPTGDHVTIEGAHEAVTAELEMVSLTIILGNWEGRQKDDQILVMEPQTLRGFTFSEARARRHRPQGKVMNQETFLLDPLETGVCPLAPLRQQLLLTELEYQGGSRSTPMRPATGSLGVSSKVVLANMKISLELTQAVRLQNCGREDRRFFRTSLPHIVASRSEEAGDVSFGTIDETLLDHGDLKADLALTLLARLEKNMTEEMDRLRCSGAEASWKEWIKAHHVNSSEKQVSKTRMFNLGEAIVLVVCPMKIYTAVLPVTQGNTSIQLLSKAAGTNSEPDRPCFKELLVREADDPEVERYLAPVTRWVTRLGTPQPCSAPRSFYLSKDKSYYHVQGNQLQGADVETEEVVKKVYGGLDLPELLASTGQLLTPEQTAHLLDFEEFGIYVKHLPPMVQEEAQQVFSRATSVHKMMGAKTTLTTTWTEGVKEWLYKAADSGKRAFATLAGGFGSLASWLESQVFHALMVVGAAGGFLYLVQLLLMWTCSGPRAMVTAHTYMDSPNWKDRVKLGFSSTARTKAKVKKDLEAGRDEQGVEMEELITRSLANVKTELETARETRSRKAALERRASMEPLRPLVRSRDEMTVAV